MIFYVIIIIILILIIGFYIYKKSTGYEVPSILSGKKPFPNLEEKPLASCPKNAKTIELPLIFDPSLGIYMTKFRLGDSSQTREFNVAVDTGSSILLVGSEKCIGCLPSYGSFPENIGKDMSNGNIGVIRYGGQQITKYKPWRARFYSLNPNDTEGFETDFGLIIDTKSPDGKPLPIIGLQGEGRGFLESLCGRKVVTLDFPRGKLILGSYDITSENRYDASLVDMNVTVKYNALEILGIRVNGQNIPSGSIPKYAIIDSGATAVIVDNNLGKYLAPGKIDLIVRGSNGNPVTLSFNNKSGNVSIESLPVSNSFILGNRWLSQYGLQIDNDNDTATFFN
jgi:hypothetical protein